MLRSALIAAGIAGVLVAPLYWWVTVKPPGSGERPIPTGIVEVGAFAQAVLDNQVLRRHHARIYPAILDDSFKGRKGFLLASFASQESDAELARRVAAIADLPAERLPSVGAGLDEVTLWYGLRIIQRHAAARRPVFPVNGHPQPPPPGDETDEAVRYFYAQQAVDQLRDLLRWPDVRMLGPESRQLLLDEVLPDPRRRWPQALTRELAGLTVAPFGPPAVLVVKVDTDPGAPTRGRVRFSLLEPDGEEGPETVDVRFSGVAAPVPLLQHFRRPSRQEGGGEVALRDDVIEVTFRDRDAPFSVVSLNAAGRGLPVRKHFPTGLAEVWFEARAVFSGKGQPPEVQFGTGGDTTFASMTPPARLGPEWQRVSIPVKLDGAESWAAGLSVVVNELSVGDALTVYVRNAYIRPLGAVASPGTH
ncbi:MAG: hypothetical protein L0Z62_23870 [Gemmataceae bacterium]|nr:hypothetical protein [Gemmataceae bacterium]